MIDNVKIPLGHFRGKFVVQSFFSIFVLSSISVQQMPHIISESMSKGVVLRFAKLTQNAMVPTKGSKHAAGFDLYSAYDYLVPPQGKIVAKTDIQVEIPEGCYGRVAPRSGLAANHHIDVGAGVVDRDYRGNVGVVLFNHSQAEFKIAKGDRVAQLICEQILYPELVEVETLDGTERGEGGFGSTGKN